MTLNYFWPKWIDPTSRWVRVVVRTIVSLLVFLAAVGIPGFHHVMALLGSLFAFTVSVVFPCLCHLELNGGDGGILNMRKFTSCHDVEGDHEEYTPLITNEKFTTKGKSPAPSSYIMSLGERIFCWALIVFGTLCGILGTVWVFLPIAQL